MVTRSDSVVRGSVRTLRKLSRVNPVMSPLLAGPLGCTLIRKAHTNGSTENSASSAPAGTSSR